MGGRCWSFEERKRKNIEWEKRGKIPALKKGIHGTNELIYKADVENKLTVTWEAGSRGEDKLGEWNDAYTHYYL